MRRLIDAVTFGVLALATVAAIVAVFVSVVGRW